jgi:hypothetical protein
MRRERSFLKSQCCSFSTTGSVRREKTDDNEEERTLGNTPEVFTTFHGTAIGGLDVLGGTNNGEGHGIDEDASDVGGFIIVIDGRGVHPDVLGGDAFPDLQIYKGSQQCIRGYEGKTYPVLEDGKVVLGEGVSFCDDRNQVDTCAETLHDFNVKGLQAGAVVRGTPPTQSKGLTYDQWA